MRQRGPEAGPRFGIRTRLVLSHLAVIVVAMGLSGFLLLSLLEQYFLQALEESLAAQAQITAQALIPGATTEIASGDAPSAAYNTIQQQQLSNLSLRTENLAPPPESTSAGTKLDLAYLAQASFQLSSELDTRIRILDGRGTVLVDSQDELQGVDLSAEPLVAQALGGQVASRTEQGDYESSMALASPVVADGALVGVVYLNQSLDDATAVLGDLRALWLASTAVALLLSGVVGLLLSGAVAGPVRRLTAAAQEVARGRLDQEVPVGSRDELGHLSQAFNDMTARLRSARQMQVDFVANVSHELRTPLTAIKGLVETLRDGAVDDPQVRDRFLGTVEGETDRLIRLVNDLLILSRADSEALNLEREPVDLVALADSCRQRLSAQASAREIELVLEAPSSTPVVQADADRIEQVLLNLLHNAIQYSRPGGAVTVGVSGMPNGGAQVTVQDRGIGIAARDLERIGERFYRADRARSRAEGGSGLGLAIAQALVQAHGGRLWLESQEGHGTLATFTLPGDRA